MEGPCRSCQEAALIYVALFFSTTNHNTFNQHQDTWSLHPGHIFRQGIQTEAMDMGVWKQFHELLAMESQDDCASARVTTKGASSEFTVLSETLIRDLQVSTESFGCVYVTCLTRRRD